LVSPDWLTTIRPLPALWFRSRAVVSAASIAVAPSKLPRSRISLAPYLVRNRRGGVKGDGVSSSAIFNRAA
jgi:hypothetical protein